MKSLLVTCRQETTATHFRLFRECRCLSLDLEASCSWKWRDSSFNLWNSWRYASPLYKHISTVNEKDYVFNTQHLSARFLKLRILYWRRRSKVKVVYSWWWNWQWSSVCWFRQV